MKKPMLPKKLPMAKLTEASASRIRAKAGKLMGLKMSGPKVALDKLPMGDPDSAAGAAN